jgi:integrase
MGRGADRLRAGLHPPGRQGAAPVVRDRAVLAAHVRADLPPIRENDLRHGAASLARKGGADMKAIQAMLRHSSLAITADTYTSLFADEGHEVAEAVAAVVPRKAVAREASETPGPRSVPAERPKGLRPVR